MDLRTEIRPEPFNRKIELSDSILTIGSCFADSIGQLFQENKFKVLVNPFGSIYHPEAIHSTLATVLSRIPSDPRSFLERDDQFFSYQYHSRFYGKSKTELSERIEKSIEESYLFLRNCGILLITYGTAWQYERLETHETVTNCHKMPAALFSKRLSTQDEIVTSFRRLMEGIRKQFPSIHVILTISPVRHLKDNLEGNSVSKAILRSACHRIVNESKDVSYFPAFEIMMDDLRDYRFYKDDLIHPTPAAEKYIWTKFCQAALTSKANGFLSRWNEIRQSLGHRPFNPGSSGHQEFLKQTLKKMEALSPLVDLKTEMTALSEQILSSHP